MKVSSMTKTLEEVDYLLSASRVRRRRLFCLMINDRGYADDGEESEEVSALLDMFGKNIPRCLMEYSPFLMRNI